MNITTYLKVTKSKARWGKASVKLFTKKPTCAANEVAVQLNIELPDALFEKPELKVKLYIDPKEIGTGTVNTTIDTKDIAKMLKDQLGIHVTVEGVKPSHDSSENIDHAEKLFS